MELERIVNTLITIILAYCERQKVSIQPFEYYSGLDSANKFKEFNQLIKQACPPDYDERKTLYEYTLYVVKTLNVIKEKPTLQESDINQIRDIISTFFSDLQRLLKLPQDKDKKASIVYAESTVEILGLHIPSRVYGKGSPCFSGGLFLDHLFEPFELKKDSSLNEIKSRVEKIVEPLLLLVQKNEFEKKNEELTAEKKILIQQAAELVEKNEKLTQENAELKSSTKVHTNALDELEQIKIVHEDEVSSLKNDIQQLQKALEEGLDKLKAQEALIKEKDKEIKSLEARLFRLSPIPMGQNRFGTFQTASNLKIELQNKKSDPQENKTNTPIATSSEINDVSSQSFNPKIS